MNIIRAFKLFSIFKGMLKNDYSTVAGVMGEMHGLPQKLGQHFTLYPGQSYNEYFDDLCSRGRQETIPVSSILKDLGISYQTTEVSAQASIGQVFQVDTDLRLLALKVKYPDVENRIRSDFALLNLLFWPLKFTPLRRNSLLPLLDNLRTSLLEECDYHKEAEAQRSFHSLFAGDNAVYVPEVVAHNQKSILTEWIDGTSLAVRKVSLGPWFIDAYLKFILRALINLRMIHADPHPGNFLLTGDAECNRKIVVLDFGSVISFTADEASAILRLLLGEYSTEQELIRDLLLLDVDPATLDYYSPVIGDLVSVMMEPFYFPGDYDFANWRLQYKMNTILASKTWEKPLVVPVKLLLFLRTMQGLYFYARTNMVRLNWYNAVRTYTR